MYNQRQLEIVLELFENEGKYMTASSFSEKHRCSLRTIQSDMRLIKDELNKSSIVEFRSMTPKGYCIISLEREGFEQFKKKLYQQYTGIGINYQGGNERVNQLILFLLGCFRPVSYYDIENRFYISHSTLLNDLKKASALLEKYHLELMRSSNKVMIDGSEINKRQLLLEKQFLTSGENIDKGNISEVLDDKDRIRSILVDAFVEFRHTISEVALNNVMIFLAIAKHRMEKGFFITDRDFSNTENIDAEYEIAEKVFIRMKQKFNLQITAPEVEFFALYMKGLGNYTSPSAISKQMDDFTLDCLRAVRKTFNIDLTNDMNLRMSLALHCSSLLIRAKYNMQLQDHLADYIQQNYPQGYDIASYMASIIEKKVGQKLTREETALLAIHLYNAITQIENRTGTCKVLLITSLRRAESILLRQTLLKWFDKEFEELHFMLPEEVTEDCLDHYDTFLTTEKGKFYEMGLAVYINQFPTKQDFMNLKLAIDGYQSIDDILNIFNRELFTVFNKKISKEKVLETMCGKTEKAYHLDGLYPSVMQRENMRCTYFGNKIAAPHPLTALSSDTFVCVGVSREPVEWEAEKSSVHLIMLIGIGKNNAKAFQLWNYLARIFSDKKFVNLLMANPIYENFIGLLKQSIISDFN